MNLKLNALDRKFFEVSGENDIRVNAAGGKLSRNAVVALGKLALCEYLGTELNMRPDTKYVSRLNGFSLDHSSRRCRRSGRSRLDLLFGTRT